MEIKELQVDSTTIKFFDDCIEQNIDSVQNNLEIIIQNILNKQFKNI